MQRRTFIGISALGAAAIGVSGIGCHRSKPTFFSILDKPRQLSAIWDVKTIRDIGIAYRAQMPAEAETDHLVDLLSVDSSGKMISTPVDTASVEKEIDQKITNDFKTGNTVIVKGWVLAVTEARQCALFSLNNQ